MSCKTREQDENRTCYEILDKMIEANQEVYDLCLTTAGFSYWFNILARKARKTDVSKQPAIPYPEGQTGVALNTVKTAPRKKRLLDILKRASSEASTRKLQSEEQRTKSAGSEKTPRTRRRPAKNR